MPQTGFSPAPSAQNHPAADVLRDILRPVVPPVVKFCEKDNKPSPPQLMSEFLRFLHRGGTLLSLGLA